MSEIFETAQKRRVVGSARTLQERLEDTDKVLYRPATDADADRPVFEAWRQTFPGVRFDRRLESLDATESECLRAFQEARLPADEPIPSWMAHLESLVSEVQGQSPEALTAVSGIDCESDLTDEDQERPFSHLSAAIAASTFERTQDAVGAAPLGQAAGRSLFDWFRDRFEERFCRLLVSEFRGNVAARDPDLVNADPTAFDTLPTTHYQGYIEYLFSGGFADLCRAYPMFARLLATETQQWDDQLETFCTRLETDRDQLADQFDVDGPLGNVTALDPLGTETFGSHRALLRVEFDCGLSVVYKPRPVTAGATFYRVLDRLDAELPTPDFDTPAFLSRGDYGWMEWVSYDAPEDQAAVTRYYERGGALTCIAYLLEIHDCSADNLVVAGEQPLLVDVETVLHPHMAAERKPSDSDLEPGYQESVLLTSLLPGTGGTERPAELATKIAGLGVDSTATQLDGLTEPVVVASQSDLMHIAHQPVTVERSTNVPRLDGTDQPPAAYSKALSKGFERAYETILDLRERGQLFGTDGILAEFDGIETRFLYRSFYTDVLKSLTTTEALHDGARFGRRMERLAVPLFADEAPSEAALSMYEAERAALCLLQKPRFTCLADETEIRADGTRVGATVDCSGMQRCRDRIEAASRSDLNEQLDIIQATLAVGSRDPASVDVSPDG